MMKVESRNKKTFSRNERDLFPIKRVSSREGKIKMVSIKWFITCIMMKPDVHDKISIDIYQWSHNYMHAMFICLSYSINELFLTNGLIKPFHLHRY